MLPDPVRPGVAVDRLLEAANVELVDVVDDPSFEPLELLLPVLFELVLADESVADPPVTFGVVGRAKPVLSDTELLALVLVLVPDPVRIDPVPRGTDLLLPVSGEK